MENAARTRQSGGSIPDSRSACKFWRPDSTDVNPSAALVCTGPNTGITKTITCFYTHNHRTNSCPQILEATDLQRRRLVPDKILPSFAWGAVTLSPGKELVVPKVQGVRWHPQLHTVQVHSTHIHSCTTVQVTTSGLEASTLIYDRSPFICTHFWDYLVYY